MELTHTAIRSGRLSSFLREEMHMSAGLMNRTKWQNRILVNSVPCHTDYPVRAGDVITVSLDEEEPDYPAEEGPLTILYEDEHLLAVDKPAGMLVHPSRVKMEGTLANLVAGYYGRSGQRSAFHPVTRLDRDTFGIVLLAKNAYVHAFFTQLQEQGKIKKTYHALTLGEFPQDDGVINEPIARKSLPSLLREVREDGKPSVTEFTVLERKDGYTKLALRPVTGRTHQLRVHCAYLGHPILGDPQYGSPSSLALSERLGIQTQALCAVRLEFVHPITGEMLVVKSEMDAQIPAAL